MLPDFRFVLGAVLAIALLAVAGLGLVTSVQLAHEARIVPLEDTRTLAFAGRAEWNQFYDPDGARRFEGLAGKTEGPLAPARLETPAETSAIAPAIAPLIAPLGPEERIADVPPHGLDPDLAREDTTHARETDPPPMAETPMAVTVAAVPAEAVGAAAPDAPGTTGSGAPPAERVASAPATAGGPDPETQAPTQPQAAGDPLPGAAPPIPRARPKAHFRRKIARAHFRRVAPISQQTWPSPVFPTTDAPWPGYDNQFTTTTPKKSNGKLTGTLTNRPQ
jgi:hypothetical protein